MLFIPPNIKKIIIKEIIPGDTSVKKESDDNYSLMSVRKKKLGIIN